MDSDVTNSLIDTLSSEHGMLKISSRIVHYLSNHSVSENELRELENLIKLFILFYESVSENREKCVLLSNDNEWFLQNSFNIIYNEEMNSTNFTTITNNLLKSTKSIRNGIILDNILSNVKKYLNYEINLDAVSHNTSKINVNRRKMHAIIERLFVLPCANIENAVGTIMRNFGFEILGYVFCEPSNSIFFEKCTIVGDLICDKIENSDKAVFNFFIPSLILVLKTKTGKSLYQKCLENKTFNSSLNIFLKKYLRNIDKSVSHLRQQNNYLLDNPISYLIYMKCNENNIRDSEILEEFTVNNNKFLQDYLSNINVLFM